MLPPEALPAVGGPPPPPAVLAPPPGEEPPAEFEPAMLTIPEPAVSCPPIPTCRLPPVPLDWPPLPVKLPQSGSEGCGLMQLPAESHSNVAQLEPVVVHEEAPANAALTINAQPSRLMWTRRKRRGTDMARLKV
jgi:hypothetical protein